MWLASAWDLGLRFVEDPDEPGIVEVAVEAPASVGLAGGGVEICAVRFVSSPAAVLR